MEILKFDTEKAQGVFKPMNAVNNGPVYKRHVQDQPQNNLEAYRAAKIPYARNHDAAFESAYGGEHSVDITAIFPNFDADPYAPESYNFACTDEYIAVTELAGTKTFYRLGQKIEHYVKKFGTIPPKDFKKWAVICEHIIRHYNEGWADGHRLGLEYWEIWNEPDLDPDDSPNKRTWGGTKAEFFDLFEIAAKHLKTCFPQLKIGGPAMAWREEWLDDFLAEMHRREVELDFISWHIYAVEPKGLTERGERIRAMMDRHGYQDAESILNEWNYVAGWEEEWIPSIQTMIGMKGAAFIMACMSAAQKSSIDMLMYYDARPGTMNGLFDYYTMRPIKGYYPFLWFSEFYGLREVKSELDADCIYSLCGVDEDGKIKAVITYYSDDADMPDKTVRLDFGREATFEVYALDEERTNEKVGLSRGLTFGMKQNTCLFLKEI